MLIVLRLLSYPVAQGTRGINNIVFNNVKMLIDNVCFTFQITPQNWHHVVVLYYQGILTLTIDNAFQGEASVEGRQNSLFHFIL